MTNHFVQFNKVVPVSEISSIILLIMVNLIFLTSIHRNIQSVDSFELQILQFL